MVCDKLFLLCVKYGKAVQYIPIWAGIYSFVVYKRVGKHAKKDPANLIII